MTHHVEEGDGAVSSRHVLPLSDRIALSDFPVTATTDNWQPILVVQGHVSFRLPEDLKQTRGTFRQTVTGLLLRLLLY